MNKKSLILVLGLMIMLSGCNFSAFDPSTSSVAIYGKDDRVDWYEIKDKSVIANSDAVVSLWHETSVIKNRSTGSYTLNTMVFQDAYNLRDSEPFAKQPIGAFCSGFLVAPDIVVTAGHCVRPDNYMDIKVVFNFKIKGTYSYNIVTSAKNVYGIKEIIARKLDEKTLSDFAVIRLDRPVTGVAPVKVSKESVKLWDYVYVLGHPCGLPMKFAPHGKVESTWNGVYFIASLDTYGGNSGSPVFNKNHEVAGILVRGETDFKTDENGKRYSAAGRFGEGVTRVSEWVRYIK